MRRASSGGRVWPNGTTGAVRNAHDAPNVMTDLDLQANDRHLLDADDDPQLTTALYRLVLRSAGMFSWTCDYSEGTIRWSENAARVIGCSVEQLPASLDDARFFCHPEDQQRLRDEFLGHASRRTQYCEFRFRGHPSYPGPKHWRAVGEYVYDEGGHVVRSIGITQDITDLTAAQENRSEVQATLQSFYESSPMMMGVVELEDGDDSDVHHLYDNPATHTFFGLAEGSTCGRSSRAMGSSPQVLAQWTAAYRRSQATRQPAQFEFRYTINGEERVMAVAVMFVDGVASSPTRKRFTYAVLDVTPLAQAALDNERALKKAQVAERTLQAVMDYLPEGLAIADAPDVHIRAVSRYSAQLLHRGDGQLTSSFDDHIPRWDIYRSDGTRPRPEELPITRATLTGEVVRNEEWVVRSGDGRNITILCNAGPIIDERGRITGGLIAWRDIDDLKRLNRERQALNDALRRADKRKDEFLATLSHELRNPLAAIRTAVQILGMGAATKEALQRSQAVIHRQVNTMALLLDDLLDVARITQGKLVLRPESVSLVEVVGAAVEGVQPMLDGKRQLLDVQLPDNDVRFDADPLRVTQVLMNLLTNASKYSSAGSRIDVQTVVAEASLTLSVKDEGIGIPAEALATVFEMFSQLDSAHRRAEGGLGIGLALVKGLVELHGGQVAVHSAGSGRGSTFSATLPLRAGACALEPVLCSAGSEAAGKLRVLVADDSRDSADILASLLELLGHEVRVAYDGRAAVTAAQAFRPDVALLDIGMPELNGYQVATRIRNEAWGANAVLVALTGWGGEHDKVDAERAGFDRHLTKPVDTGVLQGVLESAAQRSSR